MTNIKINGQTLGFLIKMLNKKSAVITITVI